MDEELCDCGHEVQDHDVDNMGRVADCQIEGCECSYFSEGLGEDDEPEDDEPAWDEHDEACYQEYLEERRRKQEAD